MLRQIRELSFLALTLVACTKDPVAPPSKPAAKAAVPDAEQTYELAFTSPTPWAAGKESLAAITVSAKAGFHVNPEYPVSFKPDGSESVKFAGERVALAAGTKTPCADKAEDACKVEFPLAATPAPSTLSCPDTSLLASTVTAPDDNTTRPPSSFVAACSSMLPPLTVIGAPYCAVNLAAANTRR